MNEIILLILSAVFMFVLHEMLHYVSLIFMSVEFKVAYISKKGFGFVVDNQYMKNNKKLGFFFLFPLILSLAFIVNPKSVGLALFSFLNLIWSLSDAVAFVHIRNKSPETRVKWADRWDEESLEKSLLSIPLKN